MRRPTVLHVVEHWGRPSERFVVDLIRSTTATRPVLAAQRFVVGGADDWHGRWYDLGRCRDAAARDPLVSTAPPGRRSLLFAGCPARVAVAAAATVERADVLHAHFGGAAVDTWRAARRLHRPFGVSLHGWDLLVGARHDPTVVVATAAADLVVVPSAFLAAAAVDAGVDVDRVRVVPSGVDLADLPFRERGPVAVPTVTFAGRFVPKKGMLEVARALGRVQTATPMRARFVGFGPLEPQLRALIAESGLDAEVVDGRRRGAVRAALAATDVAISASRTAPDGDAETLGLVTIEAQACGVPVVATRHGGVGEAVSPDAGILVDSDGDVVDSLADALRDLLGRPQDWAGMGRAGRAHVARNFELGARTADIEELWRALAAGGPGTPVPAVPPVRCEPPHRVAVVAVTHNRRRLLEQMLDALGAQTRPADEVVVIDNGSTDGTEDLLAARAEQQDPPGLRVLRRPANLDVGAGRNLGVAATTADIVAFTDDDCRPRPTWLEALLAGFRDGVDLVQGRTGPDPTQEVGPLSRSQWTPAENGLYETCNVAYRRGALDAVTPAGADGPFDPRLAARVAAVLPPEWRAMPFGEDTQLAWRVRRRGGPSRFAVHAVVDHDVVAADGQLARKRAAVAAGFPLLVREVPELRTEVLTARVLLSPRRARMWSAAAGVALAVTRRDLRPLLLAAPYVDDLIGVRGLPHRSDRRQRLVAAPAQLRRDLAETVALVRGSLRARSVVL